MSRQNVYDDERFFSAYRELRRADAGLNSALEQPAMGRLLPDVRGLSVVDLGCGTGQLARRLAQQGANRVVAVDPSERMIAVAETFAHPGVEYRRGFAEDAGFPAGSVDLVVSSLAFHYVADLPQLLGRIATWLASGGRLVASMEHPVATAPRARPAGDGPWVLTDYAAQGPRDTHWLGARVVKHHRTFAGTIGPVLRAGLQLEAIEEPAPDEETMRTRPHFRLHHHRPGLLVLGARKP
jgi:SAM-dependent methyltransferase